MTTALTAKLAKAITKERLYIWRKRNDECCDAGNITTPIVLVNVIHGDKTGIVLNITKDAPLENILELLRIAVKQVEKQIAETPVIKE